MTGFGIRFWVRAASAALLMAVFPLFAFGAEEAPPRLKYGTRIVCGGEYPGHLQGMATGGGAIYWVFTRLVVKTDLTGRVLAKAKLPHHGGGPCWHDGKLYVPLCGSGFNRKLKPGAVSKNYVDVFDADLKQIKRYPIPELEYGAGGIAVRDGHFFVVGGRLKDQPGNTVYEYDGNFGLLRRHEVDFDSNKGIQTIGFAFGKWYFGCYGTKGMAIETDENFHFARKVRPNTAFGMIPLADGLVLIGQSVRNKTHNRSAAAARVMRFTAPAAAKTPAKPSAPNNEK